MEYINNQTRRIRVGEFEGWIKLLSTSVSIKIIRKGVVLKEKIWVRNDDPHIKWEAVVEEYFDCWWVLLYFTNHPFWISTGDLMDVRWLGWGKITNTPEKLLWSIRSKILCHIIVNNLRGRVWRKKIFLCDVIVISVWRHHQNMMSTRIEIWENHKKKNRKSGENCLMMVDPSIFVFSWALSEENSIIDI